MTGDRTGPMMVSMTNTTTTPTTWTLDTVQARRDTGDSLVTVENWSCSYTTGEGPGVHAVRLSLRRTAKPYETAEHDARDGEIFATHEEAELYALNAGRLQWFRAWKEARAANVLTKDQIDALNAGGYEGMIPS